MTMLLSTTLRGMRPTRSAAIVPVLLLLLFPALGMSQSVSDVRRPGEESLWIFEKGGVEFGHCWSRYEGPVLLGNTAAHSFLEQVELALPSAPGEQLSQRMVMHLLTDEQGHPLRFEFTTAMADARATVSMTVSEGQGQVKINQGSVTRDLTVPVPDGSFLLTNNFVSHIELALALTLKDPKEPLSATLFSANLLRGLPLTTKWLRTDEEGGEWLEDNLNEKLLWRDGQLQRLTITGQDVVMRRVTQDHEPFILQPRQVPHRPTLDAEEVTITHGEVSLAGTITRAPGATGPLPSLFFISGSGGQDRNGFAGGIDVGTYQVLDHLTLAGFQVLRVDDRGTGQSVGPSAASYYDLVADARASVEFLLAHPGTDPKRVALIGHSEGGITAPILARELPQLAAVVLMAGPGRSVTELLEEQIEATVTPEEDSDARRKELRRLTREALRRVKQGESLEGLEVPVALQGVIAAEQWIKDHMAIDPLANLQEVECPVLILQGARDVQVSAERDAPLLAAALEEIGHLDSTLVVFPDLDHLFKKTDGSASVSMDYLTDRPVDEEFLALLTDWLVARLASE